MSTKKAERPVKKLTEYSRQELVEVLAKQQKLLTDGTAGKLPDGGEKIKKSIETIEQLLVNMPENPVEALGDTFTSLSLKQKTAPPAASIGDLVEMHTTPLSLPEVNMKDTFSPPIPRPNVKNVFDKTEDPEYNRLRKEHLDLFVRGRRGAKLDTKNGFKGSVALGLEEAIRLREVWREQQQAGAFIGDENERSLKYELSAEGEGEEQEFDDEEGGVMELDEVSGEGEKEEEKVAKKNGGEGEKKSAEKANKPTEPVWDVQEDIKDILDMIPQEYQKPQSKR